MTTKAALNLLGHRAGTPRLPLVEADEAETRAAARRARRATACCETAGR